MSQKEIVTDLLVPQNNPMQQKRIKSFIIRQSKQNLESFEMKDTRGRVVSFASKKYSTINPAINVEVTQVTGTNQVIHFTH